MESRVYVAIFYPDLLHDFRRQSLVTLGIDLSHVGFGMPEHDLSCFQAESLPDLRSNRMPQLVWMPSGNAMVDILLCPIFVGLQDRAAYRSVVRPRRIMVTWLFLGHRFRFVPDRLPSGRGVVRFACNSARRLRSPSIGLKQ